MQFIVLSTFGLPISTFAVCTELQDSTLLPYFILLHFDSPPSFVSYVYQII